MNFRIVTLNEMKENLSRVRKPRTVKKEDMDVREIKTSKGFTISVEYFKNATPIENLSEGDEVKIVGKKKHGRIMLIKPECIQVKVGYTTLNLYKDQVIKI
jgi:hypothetical protein